MTDNGNGIHNSNRSHRWWQIWKRERDLDLAAYRRLALQLHHGLPRADNASRSVLIVTPNESRFWAKGCVTLASCMAEELRRPVLLVDADDDCEVSRMLGSPASPGLTDFLADPVRPLQELALSTSQQNVWFLSRGTSQGSPCPASPENAHDLLARSCKQWDFVVVAGGPVLRNSFALAMAPYVGRVLLLVIENRTHIEDIDVAQNALEQCRAQNVSLVLTQLGGDVR
jgi:Mrp family chromosome partitioning ATPase